MNASLQDGRRRRLLMWATAPAAIVPVLCILFRLQIADAGSYPPPPSSSQAGSGTLRFPLTISPEPIDLGTIIGSKTVYASLSLRNSGADPLTVERVETSCPCIQVASVPIQIGPHETKTLSVGFDPASDPAFQGGLSVDVVGYGTDKQVVFRTRVELEVPLKSERGRVASPREAASKEGRS